MKGPETARFDFSGLPIVLDGVAPALLERLRSAWGGFAADETGPALLRLCVEAIDGDYSNEVYEPKRMRSTLGPDRARYWMPEGRAELFADGTGSVRLLREAGEDRSYFTLLNFVRAALAWTLPSRGGLMLHAAGIVIADRAFVLIGSADAGKSTWARLGERGGARVLSDDVVIIGRDTEGRFVALGAPLFSTHRADYRPGAWPLAAVLHPEHGETISCRDVTPLLARARVVANLPFVAEAYGTDPRVTGGVEELLAQVRQLTFTFALDSDVSAFLSGRDPSGGA